MRDFSKGKIYRLVKDCCLPYIGSTTQTLASRFCIHNKKGVYVGYTIELIENYPCKDNVELRKRERHWYDITDCCNQRRPYRSIEEKNEQQHQVALKRDFTAYNEKRRKAKYEKAKEEGRVFVPQVYNYDDDEEPKPPYQFLP